MADTYHCPADGCDYKGFRKSVIAHYSGKRDSAHKGGYAEAKSKVDASASRGSPPEGGEGGGADTSKDSNDSNTDTSDGSAAAEPKTGDTSNGGVSFPDNTKEPEPEPATEKLPCGHEAFDPADAPDPPFSVGCDTCGGEWTVTEL